jgi:hypothetical protein
MAKPIYPLTIAEKHKVLYREPLPEAELVALGDLYTEKELWHDALEFYEKAGDKDRLRQVRDTALSTADLVLFLNACRCLGAAPDEAGLKRLKAKGLELGKEATAERVDGLLMGKEEEAKLAAKGKKG